jgi:hypothetical protein
MKDEAPPGASTHYGLVILKCPFGHVVGRFMKKNTGRYNIVDGYFVSRDFKRKPLAVRCPRCEKRGIRRDLRGSWAKVRALADEVQENPDSNTGYYRLGG